MSWAPNAEQGKSAVRWGISFAGGYAVGRGWLKAETLQSLLTNEAVIGALAAAVPLVWGLVSRTNKNMVAAADAVPGVKGVVTTSTEEGRTLAESVPSPTVVAAGTMQAAEVAKPGDGVKK